MKTHDHDAFFKGFIFLSHFSTSVVLSTLPSFEQLVVTFAKRGLPVTIYVTQFAAQCKDVVFVNTGSTYVSFCLTRIGSHEGTCAG
jgi:hypothetical protein